MKKLPQINETASFLTFFLKIPAINKGPYLIEFL